MSRPLGKALNGLFGPNLTLPRCFGAHLAQGDLDLIMLPEQREGVIVRVAVEHEAHSAEQPFVAEGIPHAV